VFKWRLHSKEQDVLSVESDSYQAPAIGVWLLQGLIVLLFLTFIVRFWFLQVHLGEEFARQALANRLRNEEILAPRGRIVDVNGLPLADNQIVYGLSLVREDCDDIPATLAQVASWTDIPMESLQARYDHDKWRTQKFEPMLLASDMSIEQASRIEAQLVSWPGLEIVVRSKRRYPERDIFSHVLGYVAEANEKEMDADSSLALGDLVGKQGLEFSYEKELRGQKGRNEMDVDAVGRALEKRMLEAPRNGKEIRLTIDRNLQKAAWDALNGEAGSVVVMEPETGKIRALVTAPAYDNNLFSGGISHKNWEALRLNPRFPLQNRVTQSMYPPGSVWKLMMAAMFLEEGIRPEEGVVCPGSYRMGNHVFRCWKHSGHGYMTMQQALINSCDVYFYYNAEKVGIDKIARFAHASGFGQPTGIDLPHEKGGVVPSREWKMQRYGKAWLRGETINASIGQGYTLVTPLQMAVNVSSFLNGGMVLKPLLREDSPIEIRALVPAKRETLEFVLNAMRATASVGTAKVIKRPDADMGGKTGSAQVVKLRMDGKRVMKANELPWEQRDHGWMATWGRKEGKTYVVIAMVEHGGGGGSAAGPVAKRVYEHLFGYDPVRQRQIQIEKERAQAAYLRELLNAERRQKAQFLQYQRQVQREQAAAERKKKQEEREAARRAKKEGR
jgi:penicillin-binding protein 2